MQGMVIDDRSQSLLPVSNRPWPPPEYDPITYQMRLWSAWYSGDSQMLSWAYYNLGANSPAGRAFFATTGEAGLPTPRPGQYRGGLLGSITRLPGLTNVLGPARFKPLRVRSARSTTFRSLVTSARRQRTCCSASCPRSSAGTGRTRLRSRRCSTTAPTSVSSRQPS